MENLACGAEGVSGPVREKTMTTKYKGFVEEWQAELALGRIRRFGFPEHERLDLLQELAMKVRQFTFDVAKSNGAKASTVFCAVVDRHLLSRARAKRRAEQNARKYRQLKVSESAPDDEVELCVDVRQLVASLTKEERAVCDGISRGLTMRAIAKQLGCALASVGRAKRRIRKKFAEAGLKGWLQD
jgi:DNA-binding NarL/FixJ family response regulator